MENVFRDYGRFENESNNQIICFNVTRTYFNPVSICLLYIILSSVFFNYSLSTLVKRCN